MFIYPLPKPTELFHQTLLHGFGGERPFKPFKATPAPGHCRMVTAFSSNICHLAGTLQPIYRYLGATASTTSMSYSGEEGGSYVMVSHNATQQFWAGSEGEYWVQLKLQGEFMVANLNLAGISDLFAE